MKIVLVLIFALLTVIYAAEDVHRKRHEQHPNQANSSDKPVEIRRIAMPKSIKIVVSPKPTSQPLRSLYKSYVGKKPLMRKFVPVVIRTTEQPIPITRRSLMKQRQFVIGPSTIKPYQKKADLFITTRRRINFRPSNNITAVKDNDAINKTISEGRIVKSRIVAVSDTDKSYEDLSVLPKDKVYAGSQKIYTILFPPNSNFKNRSIEPENNDKIEKKGTFLENNIKDEVEPVSSTQDNSMKIEKIIDNYQNESKAADQDKKEFIFIPDITSKLDNENKLKATEEKEVENDINKT